MPRPTCPFCGAVHEPDGTFLGMEVVVCDEVPEHPTVAGWLVQRPREEGAAAGAAPVRTS